MSAFFAKLRDGPRKAAFHLDRRRRLKQEESVAVSLSRRLDAQTAEMGRLALTLYDRGAIVQPELQECGRKIDSLRDLLAEQEATVAWIRQEKPPEAPVPALYGHICLRCQIKLPDEAEFCSQCGSQAADLPPPAPPASRTCKQCGAVWASGALFCSGCGAPMERETPSEEPAEITCQSCHATIPAEAEFCPKCGKPLASTVAEPVPEAPLREERAQLGQLICHHCRASVSDEAEYCPECGQSLEPAPATMPTGGAPAEGLPEQAELLPGYMLCPHCQAMIPEEAIFCPGCGKTVVPAVAGPEPEGAPSGFSQAPSSPEPETEDPSRAGEVSLPDEQTTEDSAIAVEETVHPLDPRADRAQLVAEEPLPPAQRVLQDGLPEEELTASPPTVSHIGLAAEETTPTVCPSCGLAIVVEGVYCPECGSRVGGAPA